MLSTVNLTLPTSTTGTPFFTPIPTTPTLDKLHISEETLYPIDQRLQAGKAWQLAPNQKIKETRILSQTVVPSTLSLSYIFCETLAYCQKKAGHILIGHILSNLNLFQNQSLKHLRQRCDLIDTERNRVTCSNLDKPLIRTHRTKRKAHHIPESHETVDAIVETQLQPSEAPHKTPVTKKPEQTMEIGLLGSVRFREIEPPAPYLEPPADHTSIQNTLCKPLEYCTRLMGKIWHIPQPNQPLTQNQKTFIRACTHDVEETQNCDLFQIRPKW